MILSYRHTNIYEEVEAGFLPYRTYRYKKVLKIAARKGYKHIISYLYNKEVKHLNTCLYTAAKYKHVELVKYIMDTHDCYSYVASIYEGAAHGGCLELVMYIDRLLEYTDIPIMHLKKRALHGAIQNNHVNVVKYIEPKEWISADPRIANVIVNNQIKMMEVLKPYLVPLMQEFYRAKALELGHMEMAKLLEYVPCGHINISRPREFYISIDDPCYNSVPVIYEEPSFFQSYTPMNYQKLPVELSEEIKSKTK